MCLCFLTSTSCMPHDKSTGYQLARDVTRHHSDIISGHVNLKNLLRSHHTIGHDFPAMFQCFQDSCSHGLHRFRNKFCIAAIFILDTVMSADIILTGRRANSKLFRLLFKRIANALDQFDGMVLYPLLAPILTFFGPLFNVSRPFRSNNEPFPVFPAFAAHSLQYQLRVGSMRIRHTAFSLFLFRSFMLFFGLVDIS